MKIVVASDSFKGCLSSLEVGQICREGLLRLWPDAEVTIVPVADGGEGTVEALGGERIVCRTVGPRLHPLDAVYTITGRTAVIELATSCRLTLLAENERNPGRTSTYGFGMMIADAYRRGARDFIIGLGGSATCDGGAGMLAALGFDLGTDMPVGDDMMRIRSIVGTPMCAGAHFDIACDVDNPYYGPEGAAYVFAPQKGASPAQVATLDCGLRNMAAVLLRRSGIDVEAIAGSGAAGGVAGAMAACLDARICNGAELILNRINFDRIISGADLVITGEGSMDSQTLRGKLPMGVLDAARRQDIPVAAIAGRVADRGTLLSAGFKQIIQVTPEGTPLRLAMQPAAARQFILTALEGLEL